MYIVMFKLTVQDRERTKKHNFLTKNIYYIGLIPYINYQVIIDIGSHCNISIIFYYYCDSKNILAWDVSFPT